MSRSGLFGMLIPNQEECFGSHPLKVCTRRGGEDDSSLFDQYHRCLRMGSLGHWFQIWKNWPNKKKSPSSPPFPVYAPRGYDPKNFSRFGISNLNNPLVDILHVDIGQVRKRHLLSSLPPVYAPRGMWSKKFFNFWIQDSKIPWETNNMHKRPITPLVYAPRGV